MYKKYFLLLLVVVMVIWGIAPSALAQDEGIRGIVVQIAVSGDKRVMAVAYSSDSTSYPIDFFDTETLLLLQSVDRTQFNFGNFALDPSGVRMIGTGSSGELVIFDRRDGTLTTLREGGQFASLGTLQWSSTDSSVVAFVFGGSVEFLNVDTNEFIGAINSDIGNIVDFSFAPSGNAIVTSSFVSANVLESVAHRGVEIWNPLPTGGQVLLDPTLRLDDVGGDVEWSPDGDRLASLNSSGLSIYNLQSEQFEATGLLSEPDTQPTDFAWSPNGDYIATNGDLISIWDTNLMVIVRQLGDAPSVRQLAWSPDGQQVYGQILGAGGGLGVFTIDLDEISNIPLRLISLCSPDSNTVRLWRVRNTNPDPVTFTWDVLDTDQMGSGSVPGGTEEIPGEVTFETVAVDGSPNTARIFVGGQFQDQQDNSGEVCN